MFSLILVSALVAACGAAHIPQKGGKKAPRYGGQKKAATDYDYLPELGYALDYENYGLDYGYGSEFDLYGYDFGNYADS